MEKSELLATLEAVLFAVGEPIEGERIAQALGVDLLVLNEAARELSEKYDESSGLCLLRLEDKLQLCTKKAFADKIRAVIEVKKNAPLSQAALEVLAIVAYNQPVTKAFVEQIRGVDCSAVISNLCLKALIEEKGRLDLPGRPLIYGTTAEFLRCFNLSSLEELPELPEEKGEENEDTSSDDEEKNAENQATLQNDLQIEVDEN